MARTIEPRPAQATPERGRRSGDDRPMTLRRRVRSALIAAVIGVVLAGAVHLIDLTVGGGRLDGRHVGTGLVAIAVVVVGAFAFPRFRTPTGWVAGNVVRSIDLDGASPAKKVLFVGLVVALLVMMAFRAYYRLVD